MTPRTISLICSGIIKMRTWDEYQRDKPKKLSSAEKRKEWIRQMLNNEEIK